MSYLTYYFKDLFNGVLVFIGLLNLINKWPAKKSQSQIPLPNNWIIIAGLHYSMQNASFTLAKTVYDIPSIIQRTYEKKYFNSQKTTTIATLWWIANQEAPGPSVRLQSRPTLLFWCFAKIPPARSWWKTCIKITGKASNFFTHTVYMHILTCNILEMWLLLDNSLGRDRFF